MNSQPPTNLIFEDSSLTILYEDQANLNRTRKSVVIRGTKGGFLSLANAMFFYLNDLQEIIKISDLPYVRSSIRLTIEQHEPLTSIPYGTICRISEIEFTWKMSESEICRVASEMHSLGYINKELHLDETKGSEEITVYCVVV